MRVTWTFLLFQLSCFALKTPSLLDIARIEDFRNSITLDNGTKTLGLQNALDPGYPYPNKTIALFLHACNQTDGTFNCTAVCQNTSTMFSDIKTLHNCAVFPEVFLNYANNNLTTKARRLAQELNINPSNNESSLPSDVSNKIQTCLIDSCTIDSDCNKTLNGTNSNPAPNNYTGASFIHNGNYFRLCGHTPAYVDADVGGIGV